MDKYFKNKTSAILISLFAMFLWGSAIPMIKTMYIFLNVPIEDTGAKILIAGIRFFFAGVLSLVYMILLNKEKIDKSKINYKFLIVLGIEQITLQYIFYYIGLSNAQGVKASIVQASNALIMVLLSCMLLPFERLTVRKILALFIGTLGIIISNLKGTGDLAFKINGEGAVLLSTTLNALGSVLVRKYGQDQNSFVISVAQFLIGSIPLCILGYSLHYTPLVFDFKAIVLMLYGSFISATSFTLWYMVLKYHSSGEFGVYKLFVPIFGTITSIIFLSEEFTFRLLIGLVFVIFGSYVLNSKLKILKALD